MVKNLLISSCNQNFLSALFRPETEDLYITVSVSIICLFISIFHQLISFVAAVIALSHTYNNNNNNSHHQNSIAGSKNKYIYNFKILYII